MKKTILSPAFLIVLSVFCFSFMSCTGPRDGGGGENDTTDSVIGGDRRSDTISFKFYFERSGSMYAYDCSKGTIKSNVLHMRNTIPNACAENAMLYIVNDGVYPCQKSLKDFCRDSSVFSKEKIGDDTRTDFYNIFDSILTRTGESEVSILLSDLLYSIEEQAGNRESVSICSEARELTSTVFRAHGANDVLVMKMNGWFDGKYYTFDSPRHSVLHKGYRPYYFMIVASPSVMRTLLTSREFLNFHDFKSYDGFENYYCFSTEKTVDYSLLFTDNRIRGRFKVDRSAKNANKVHSIKDLESNRREKEITLVLAADLSSVFVPQDYITDTANYEVSGSISGFKVVQVQPIAPAELDANITRYVPNATHFVVISTSEPVKNETLTIALKDRLPSWIEESSTSDDRNLRDPDFAHTTFAFKDMMEGIYQAYHGTAEVPNHFKLTVSIQR